MTRFVVEAFGLIVARLQRMVEAHSFACVAVLVVGYVVFFSRYTCLNHQTYQTYAYDLGIYMQSLWNTIHGNGLMFTSLWEGSRFMCHFEPVTQG